MKKIQWVSACRSFFLFFTADGEESFGTKMNIWRAHKQAFTRTKIWGMMGWGK